MASTKKSTVREASARGEESAHDGQLSSDDWALAALLAWGTGGLRAVAVEPLARRLGVTKGSFYWHFRNRAALLERALDFWRVEGTEGLILRLDAICDPELRLRALFEGSWDRLDHLRTEAAIGAAALSGEPTVAPVYQAVQRRRLDYLASIYKELGHPVADARRLAIAAFSAFLGSVQIILQGDPSLQTEAQLKRQMRVFSELLVVRPSRVASSPG